MSISFGLGTNLKLGTSQKLTPQMQQAIRLLQMSSIELEQEVQQQLESNPMLEREENNEDALNNVEETVHIDDYAQNNDVGAINDYGDATAIDSFDKLSAANFDDNAVDTHWDNVYTSAPRSLASASEQTEIDGYLGNTTASIQDYIRWQLNFKSLANTDTVIADYLIDAMDDSGFINLETKDLHSSISMIASFYQWEESIEESDIEKVLKIIQSCDPLGVGARNLTECLSLQLDTLPKDTLNIDKAYQLLAHSQYLLNNNISALLQETELSIDDIEPALALIRTLNPAPGLVYTDSQQSYGLLPESYDIPDVLVSAVSKSAGDKDQPMWKVELNPDTLPKIRVNQEYASFVKRGDNSPDNQYLRENLINAKLFIRSIEERNHNLLRVATCIVNFQQDFLLNGVTSMKPMILKDVAEIVELHESTVSRLTTSKSILTPQGLFSLKYFFSSSVSSDTGDVSSTAICAIINELVTKEDPKKPLSDNAIAVYLKEQGIDIARRTISKYREQLKIGSSSQRKQRY